MDAAGRWTIVWIALLVVQGLLPLATVWLTRSLVDGLVAGIRAGGSWAALIITHRFTTAMSADAIHVMDAGGIVESGSHAELLALGGRYAAGWTTQR